MNCQYNWNSKIERRLAYFSVNHDANKSNLTGYSTKFVFPKSADFKLAGKLLDYKNARTVHDAIIYDLAIVGISEKGYSYFQKSKFKEGKIGLVELDRVSEEKLNASIEQLNRNRISKPMSIKDELDWLIIEQKNYVEKRNRQNQHVFKERIKKIVFPCYETVVRANCNSPLQHPYNKKPSKFSE